MATYGGGIKIGSAVAVNTSATVGPFAPVNSRTETVNLYSVPAEAYLRLNQIEISVSGSGNPPNITASISIQVVSGGVATTHYSVSNSGAGGQSASGGGNSVVKDLIAPAGSTVRMVASLGLGGLGTVTSLTYNASIIGQLFEN